MNAAAAAGALVDGLWRRLRDAALAEERLAGFAFAEGGGPAPRWTDLAGGPLAEGLARDLTLRALAAGADPVNYRLLAGLGEEPAPLRRVAEALGLPLLAVSERVGALAQVGLATRDLEREAVAGTRAGRGLVALVEAVSAGLAARCRSGPGEER